MANVEGRSVLTLVVFVPLVARGWSLVDPTSLGIQAGLGLALSI